jgi:hypothetical protein
VCILEKKLNFVHTGRLQHLFDHNPVIVVIAGNPDQARKKKYQHQAIWKCFAGIQMPFLHAGTIFKLLQLQKLYSRKIAI